MAFTIINFQIGHQEYDGWSKSPNSAGGVSIRFRFKHDNAKIIKYATFGFSALNGVGDVVTSDIGRYDPVQYGRVTGPVASNQPCPVFFENMFYNHSITSVKIVELEVQYMDGTEEKIPASQISYENGACYVATAVYGSYDCPQVWTLRRYRDYTLGETWYGRAFIRTYYAISPTLVKWFGNTEWFKKMWKGKLDRMVAKLNAKGIDNSPYDDMNW